MVWAKAHKAVKLVSLAPPQPGLAANCLTHWSAQVLVFSLPLFNYCLLSHLCPICPFGANLFLLGKKEPQVCFACLFLSMHC